MLVVRHASLSQSCCCVVLKCCFKNTKWNCIMLTIHHVHDLFAAGPGIVVPPPCQLKEGQPDHHTTHLGRLKCCAHQILPCKDGIVHGIAY